MHTTKRGAAAAVALLAAVTLAPAQAQEAQGPDQDDGTRLLVQRCPAVKARLDRAFSRRPDFAAIGDAANERIAECQYFKELATAVGDGYAAFQQCRDAAAGEAAGIAAKKAELRSILARIRQAAVRTCDD